MNEATCDQLLCFVFQSVVTTKYRLGVRLLGEVSTLL